MITNLDKASGAPIVAVKDGVTYEFPPLRRGQIGALLARWAAQDRAALKARLDESKATPEMRFAALNEFDGRTRLVSWGYSHLFEFERCAESIVESLKLQREDVPPDVVDGLPFAQDELVDIACLIWGLKPANADDKDDVSTKKNNPNSPSTG